MHALMRIVDSRKLSDGARYRWMVFSRILAAAMGGFLIANLSVPLVTALFPGRGILATYSGMLFSYVVWLIVILWVFSASSATRAWIGAAGTALALSVLALLSKSWS